jgi:curved DNA-binding protein CbpA
VFPWGILGEKFRWGIQTIDSEGIAMETLYDLLGALPNDDADELRAAFRRAAKRVHPDKHPEDPGAAVKFRRIVRANEILGDAEQRAAYDHLLAHARQEQAQQQAQEHEQPAQHATADKVHKVARGVIALAGISVGAVGGYALFVQLSANAMTPTTTTTAEAVREPAADITTRPAEESSASVSAAPRETSTRADITPPAIVRAAETAPRREGPTLGHTAKHASKFAPAYTDRSIFLYRLRKFTHAFAEFAEAKPLQRASRPITSWPPQSRTR